MKISGVCLQSVPRRLHMRVIGAAIAALFFVVTASADMGALVRYRGDWMINGNRKHLVATRWRESNQSLEIRYSYQVSTCPRWTRESWVMRHDGTTNTYSAVIRGRKSEESATGHWDESSNTMIWTTGAEADNSEEAGGVRRYTHVFGVDDVTWATTYIHKSGKQIENRPLTWKVLVPYEEPLQ